MRVSVRCFGYPLPWYRPVAMAAERLGFDGVWIPDHAVAMTATDSAYPYSATGKPSFQPDTPFADPFTMLGHLAAVTERVRLGIGVFVLPLRHPLLAARAAMSVQELSGGRLVLGVGVGWLAAEFAALDAAFANRGARMEEQLAIMRAAWRGEPMRHDGRWYRFAELTIAPPVSTPIPVLIGGASAPALDRAVRLGDGWYAPPGPLEQTAASVRDVGDRLARHGRDRASFQIVVRAPEATPTEAIPILEDLGVDETVVNLPRDVAHPDEIVDWLERLASTLGRGGARGAA